LSGGRTGTGVVTQLRSAAAIAQVGHGGALRHRLPRHWPRQVSAGAAVAFDRRRQPHLTNHIDAAISRFLDARFDGEARQSLTRMGGAPAGPRRPFPRTPPRTIRTPVGAPPLVGGGVTGSNLRAPRRRPVSSDLGFARSGGGPRPRRNGGDVHRGTTTEPAACAPAGAQQQLRVGPGPILTDRFERQRAATASPAWFRPSARHPEHGGNKPCRRWKQRHRRRRSSTA
jgi:hypothetical protein